MSRGKRGILKELGPKVARKWLISWGVPISDMLNADKTMFSVSQQNSVCMSCHQPEKLREAFWPHDVHMLKLSCVSCHQLHPKTDPMHGLDDKGRVRICVDCHRRQQELIPKDAP